MIGLRSLWLPILLSAVAVFILSSLIHMLLPWHKGDYRKLPDEDKVRDLLRPMNIPPGDYMVPRPSSMEEMKSPAFVEKFKQGPNFMVTFLPANWNMGKSLVLWFLYSLVIGVFAGYVAGRANGGGAPYLHVFRFAGVTAFLGYSGALAQMSIWYNRNWTTTIKSMFDGLLYGLVTAGFFGWLWPR